MTAYSRSAGKGISQRKQYGYEAVKHQRFVGTGYFDQVQQVISGGLASTMALAGSTEAEQFSAGVIPAGKMHQAIVAERPFPDMPQDEMLQPSGD